MWIRGLPDMSKQIKTQLRFCFFHPFTTIQSEFDVKKLNKATKGRYVFMSKEIYDSIP